MTPNQSQINLKSAFQNQSADQKPKAAPASPVLGNTFAAVPSEFKITKVAKEAITKTTLGKSAVIMGLLALVFFLIPHQEPTEATPADLTQNEDFISLSAPANLTAGESVTLTSSKVKPGSLVTAQITTPSSHQITLSQNASQNGIAELTLEASQTKTAGIFLVHPLSDELFSHDTTFQIKPAAADSAHSDFTASKAVLEANGQDEAKLKVALRDQFDNAISGSDLKIISSRSSDLLSQTSLQTNQNGEVSATLRSITSGSAFLTAFDVTSGQVIGNPLEIRFQNPQTAASSNDNLSRLLSLLSGNDTSATASLNSSDFLLADLASPFAASDVDHFEIEGLPSEITVGDPISSLTVRAVDANGFRVDDYQGTVHFRVDDDSAILPLDTTFKADNAGERDFDLAVTFTKAGLHTLIVEDTLDNSIFGRIDNIEVTGLPGNQTASPQITSPIDNTTLSTSKVKVAGRATVGSLVSIYDGTNKLGEVVADNIGQWLFTTPELFDGTHQLAAIAIADDSEISPVSATVNIIIDSTNPQPATVTLEPETVAPRGQVKVTVETEQNDLQKAELIIDKRIIELSSSPLEPQIFTGSFIAPKDNGSFDIDLTLTDDLDNAETFRQLAILRVIGEIETEPIGTALVPVSNVRIIDRGPNYITLSWKKVTSAERYQINYGETSDSLDYSTLVTSDSNQTTIDGLISGVTYHFSVQAIDSDGRFSEVTAASQASGQPQLSETFAADDEIASISTNQVTTVKPESTSNSEIISADETVEFIDGKKVITKVIKVPKPDENPEVGPASTLTILLSIFGLTLITLIKKHKQLNLQNHLK